MSTDRKGLSTTEWLVIVVAAIGFLFDTYELLMFPVIGADAISELVKIDPAHATKSLKDYLLQAAFDFNLLKTDPAIGDKTGWMAQLGLADQPGLVRGDKPDGDAVRQWAGRMLWVAALAGGVFGLLGGLLIDRFGRKTVMVGSILVYSLSPVAAAYSTELWHLVLFRCTTFVGVCVELVAAVTWLAELFDDKRKREQAIGWTLACASLGGIFVTEVYNGIVSFVRDQPGGVTWLPVPAAAWRYTLLTGLVPGALILLLMPFVPESRQWKEKKRAGTLKRPRFTELFSPALRRTTIVTTLLSACGYAAAFGALQLTPLQMAPGLPAINEKKQEAGPKVKAAIEKVKATSPGSDERKVAEAEEKAAKAIVPQAIKEKRGNIQRWQELGGLAGRVLFAILLVYLASRMLIRLFLIPGVILFPVTYLILFQGDYTSFAIAIFFCGLFTIAQFSYVSEFLPKVFPLHLRGTGSAFATNVGGRMIGTMAAALNTEWLSTLFEGNENPVKVATAAAIIGGSVFLVALILSFFLPEPNQESAE